MLNIMYIVIILEYERRGQIIEDGTSICSEGRHVTDLRTSHIESRTQARIKVTRTGVRIEVLTIGRRSKDDKSIGHPIVSNSSRVRREQPIESRTTTVLYNESMAMCTRGQYWVDGRLNVIKD